MLKDYLYNFSDVSDFFDSIYNGIIVIDKNSNIVLFNETARKLFKLEEQDVLGYSINNVLPESQLPMVLNTGESKMGVKIDVGDTFVISNQSPVRINGELVGATSVFQDMYDLDKISYELKSVREQAAELNAIVENSYDGIYVTDATGKTIRVNKAYERITGLSIDNLINRNIKDIVNEGLISESITFKILKSKDTLTIKQTISTGKEILVTGTPILDEQGEISRVVTNVRDMTELNNLQKELESSRELTEHYKLELSELKKKYEDNYKIIAQSKQMQNLLDTVKRVASVETTALILGESGVGKEIIAQIIHDFSFRKGNFIKINCGAIPENLIESELFGYEEGAFTGAKKGGKVGLIELANKGTLFLDEVADFPLHLQGKLLRVLEEGEITRVGGTESRDIDVRIVSATNKDLKEMVKNKEYREDLFFRLNVVPIHIPPLRERKEDISGLIVHYLEYFNKKYNTSNSFSPQALELLCNYYWPGNVRELINTIERMVVTSFENIITPSDLPESIRNYSLLEKAGEESFNSLQEAMDNYERSIIMEALKKHKTTRKAALALNISQSALVKKTKRLGIVYNGEWEIKSGDSSSNQ